MRREKKEKLNSRRKFPLFWKKCECCESEYRLEWVWGFIINTFQGMTYDNHIVCRSCAETRQDADKFAIAYTEIRNNGFPPMPPVMPPKTSAEKEIENFSSYLRGTEWTGVG